MDLFGNEPSPIVISAETLVKRFAEVKAFHHQVVMGSQQVLESAKRAGIALAKLKADVPYGQWVKTLEQHWPGQSRTARAYIRVAANWEQVKRATSLREALQLLSDEAEPDDEKPPDVQTGTTSDWQHAATEQTSCLSGASAEEKGGSGALTSPPTKPPPEPPDIEDLRRWCQEFQRIITAAINGDHAICKRLNKYLSAVGFVDHQPVVIEKGEVKGGGTKLIALKGICALLRLAAESEELSDAEVKAVVDKATGGWVPHPKLRRNNKKRWT